MIDTEVLAFDWVPNEWDSAPDLRAVNVVNGGGLDSALDPPGRGGA